MAESSTPDEGENPGPGIGWGDGGPNIYTNILAVIPGPFDVTLIFGHEDGSTRNHQGGGTTKKEVVRVSMSWAHAKSMIPLLANMVATYENQWGTIPAPGFDQMWKGSSDDH